MAELAELDQERREWVATWRPPEWSAYGAHVRVLDQALRTVLDGLQGQGRAARGAPGDVYQVCREIDVQILGARRVFEFFRQRLEQRREPRYGSMLRAAEKVVWSCHLHFWRPTESPVPPLPFVEAWYSPAAFPVGLVPPALRAELGDEVSDAMEELPIPLLRLPPWCRAAPWWLVLVGHEMGHHAQHRLQDGALVAIARDSVRRTAARAEPRDASVAERWGRWSEELFADLVSLILMGWAAARALLELEYTRDQQMLVDRERYPSPCTRLGFLRAAARRLEVAIPTDDFDPSAVVGDMPHGRRELEIADQAAQNLIQAVGQALGRLDWCRVPEAFRSGGPPPNATGPEQPRLLVSAAHMAWPKASDPGALADQTLRVLDTCPVWRPRAVRRAAIPGPRLAGAIRSLARETRSTGARPAGPGSVRHQI